MRPVVHDDRMPPNEDQLIGTAEAARILGKSHRTIHRLVETGELAPALVAPGGRAGAFLFRKSDVEALVNSSLPTP